MVGVANADAVPAEVLAEQFALVLVLVALLVLVDPVLWVFALDFRRQQSGEHGVAGELGGGGQEGVVDIVAFDAQVLLQQWLDGLPLVVAEVVDDDEEHRVVAFEQGEEPLAEQGVAHQGFLLAAGEPVAVVVFDKAAEEAVGVAPLREEDVVDIAVVDGGEFEVPAYQAALHLGPLVGIAAAVELHGQVAELALVVHRRVLALQASPFGEALDGQQQLAGTDRLDQVVADASAEGVLHDVLLFALGHHDHWHGGPPLLDGAEGVQPCQAGHLLVEQHQVGLRCLQLFQRIGAGAYGIDCITFLFEEEDVGLEEVDLVVGPEDGGFHRVEVLWYNVTAITPHRRKYCLGG